MPLLTRILGSTYQRGLVASAVCRAALRWPRATGERVSSAPYVESNPLLARLIPPLAEVFPALVVVHVVRHPVSYIESVERFGTFGGWKRWAMRVVPALTPEVRRTDYRREFGVDTPVVRAAAYWSALNELIDSDAQRPGIRYRRLRYEDLFAGDRRAVETLSTLCEARPADLRACMLGPRINASDDREWRTVENWSRIECDLVATLCGSLARKYGYEGWPAVPAVEDSE